ncbi:potassium channel [Aureococcus anophagefferens]|nr:potassium channel [Aureococcus anophagefferens]
MLCSLLFVRLRRWGSDHRSLGAVLKDLFIIASYYVVGILVLHRFEGWSTVDSIYFLSVTVTTIGYGDISPTTNAGQLASCALILAGIVFVLTTLSKYASALATLVRTLTKSIMRLAGHEMVNVGDLPIEGFSPATVNSLIFYRGSTPPPWRRSSSSSSSSRRSGGTSSTSATSRPLLRRRHLHDRRLRRLRAADPGTSSCSFFLVLAVVSDTISQLFDIRLKKRIREGKSCQPDLEGLLLAKIRDQGADPRTVAVYESDYVVAALVESGIVDADTCRAIRRFYHWTALGADGDHHDIDLGDLHHASAQEEAQLRKAAEAHCAAHYHVYASAATAPGKVAPEEKARRVDDAERPAAGDSPRAMPPANHLAPLAG